MAMQAVVISKNVFIHS